MASGVQYWNDLPIVTLTNSNGMLVNITLIGAIIQALVVPDRCGRKYVVNRRGLSVFTVAQGQCGAGL